MQSSISLRARLFLTFLIAYLVFLPTGPYPFFLAGFRVEYVLFALVCGASLTLLSPIHRKLNGSYGGAMLCVLVYLMVIGLTTLLSSEPDMSDRAFFTTCGYAYLTLVAPPLIYRHMNVVRQALLWMAGATSIVLVYFYSIQGYGSVQRFTLADTAVRTEADTNYVDPNMTAIGLIMCVIIALPLLLGVRQQGGLKRTFNRLTAVAVIGSALFFESRTTVLSLVIGAIWALLRAGSGVQGMRTAMRRAVVIMAMFVIAGVANWNSVLTVMGRMENTELDTSGENGRIALYKESVQDWMTNDKTLILGNGYFISNPHNEFLRTLVCDGLIGLTAFVLLPLGVYLVCCRGPLFRTDQILSQNLLFGYIVSAMMTYGHTKTMWLAYLFLLAGYLEAQARSVRFRKGAGVVVEHFRMPGRVSAFSQG